MLFKQKWFYSCKSCCISAEVVVFSQSGCIPEKVVVLWQKLLYSDNNGCIRAKVVLFGQSGCIRAKVVGFRQIVVFVQKWL